MEKTTDSKLLKEIKTGGGGLFELIIAKIILRLIDLLQKYKRSKYERVVSLGDLFIDREEKAKLLGFGEGATIYDSSLVIGDVQVGKYTWVGPYTILDGSGGLVIGDYSSISAGVHIYTHDTVEWTLSGGKAEYKYAPITIGNCCYIGPHTIISKGVKIGDYCLVGANSFVNIDLNNYSVAAGSPCKIIGEVKISEKGRVEILMNKDL